MTDMRPLFITAVVMNRLEFLPAGDGYREYIHQIGRLGESIPVPGAPTVQTEF